MRPTVGRASDTAPERVPGWMSHVSGTVLRMAGERASDQDENRVPLGAVTIPAGEVSPDERKALARKLYRRMLGGLPPRD